MVESFSFSVSTKGDNDTINLSSKIDELLKKSSIKNGIGVVFVSGSTAGISTIEYEPGLLEDVKKAVNRWAPRELDYAHQRSWGGEDNGHSHIRSFLIGTSFTFPVKDGSPLLGAWQQIVLVDFDTRPRQRKLTLQLIGEAS